MAIIGDVFIKVDSAVLGSKAQEVSGKIANMANCFDQMERIINRTSYYWLGEAGELHRKMYRDQKSQVDEMMKRLREHPADLTAIAQTYESTEKEVQAMAVELPGDVIS